MFKSIFGKCNLFFVTVDLLYALTTQFVLLSGGPVFKLNIKIYKSW